MSAVSTKFPPVSTYRSKIARDSLSAEPQLSLPKVIVPKPNGLTRKPDRPSVMYSFMRMASFYHDSWPGGSGRNGVLCHQPLRGSPTFALYAHFGGDRGLGE